MRGCIGNFVRAPGFLYHLKEKDTSDLVARTYDVCKVGEPLDDW
ncbi:hypothetical protein [Thermosporothrix hazakensis]|nr:hypothetical protein [Thermosporothrix hazakensis]